MFDERFVAALAAEIAARISPQIQHESRGANKQLARLLTVREAAAYIGRTEQAVQHLIYKRDLIVVRKGRRVHIDRNDLDRWIEANKF
jgi:excisionase family DNA binding protein